MHVKRQLRTAPQLSLLQSRLFYSHSGHSMGDSTAAPQTQTVIGWAALDNSGKITRQTFERRENGANDVTIEILYCGICHTDIHVAKDDCAWGSMKYPIVPGHEITGIIKRVGSNVPNFKVGDRVGVGAMGATCLNCEYCESSQENYCEKVQFIIGGTFWDGAQMQGGFAKLLVSDHRYVVHVPENLPMDAVAPLLCAGITVFPPMKYNHLFESSGKRVGVVGLGGLGHVAVKFAKAFGHHVTIISTSPSKEKEAKYRLGVDDFIVSTDAQQMQANKRSLDFILDTTPVGHPLGPTLELLKVNGTLSIVGVPGNPYDLPSIPLLFGRRNVQGNLIGSIKETQEMMDMCGKLNITCEIEVIGPNQINEAFDRILRNDIKYRFVIDMARNS